MVSERSVNGLKSAIYFLISNGKSNQTPRRGKNLKKGKRKDRDTLSGLIFTFLFFLILPLLGVWLLVPWLIRNKKSALIIASCHNSNICDAKFFWHKSRKFAN